MLGLHSASSLTCVIAAARAAAVAQTADRAAMRRTMRTMRAIVDSRMLGDEPLSDESHGSPCVGLQPAMPAMRFGEESDLTSTAVRCVAAAEIYKLTGRLPAWAQRAPAQAGRPGCDLNGDPHAGNRSAGRCQPELRRETSSVLAYDERPRLVTRRWCDAPAASEQHAPALAELLE